MFPVTQVCAESPPPLTLTASGGTPPYQFTGQTINLIQGNYLYTVTDNAGCLVSTQTLVTITTCIVPPVTPNTTGQDTSAIGSTLTQYHDHPNDVEDTTEIVQGSILIEVVAFVGKYDTLLSLLQTPAYGMTDLLPNGDTTLKITGMFPVANLLKLDSFQY